VLTERDVLGIDGASTDNPHPRTRGVLLDDDGFVALIYVEKHGIYTLPGGRIENDESYENAFIREVLEETGCRCNITTELGCIIQIEGQRVYIQYCYLAQVYDEKGLPAWTDESHEENLYIEWHTLDDCVKLIRQYEPPSDIWRFIQERDLLILQAVYDFLHNNKNAERE
jgi:ADP-ribose pyrophosphatase YjhB (NUDIX family)